MKVPEVVHTAKKMIEHMAMDGPESQSHQVIENHLCPVAQAGPSAGTPTAFSRRCSTPSGRENQLGPWIPNQLSAALTTPLALNRKRKTMEMATEEVTEGK